MNIKLGKVLKSIRKTAKLSQQDVANIINCSRGSYSCWEQDIGEIPFTKLLNFLNHCNISLLTFIKSVQDENKLVALVLKEIELSEPLDIQAELTFISNRIALLNQNLMIKS